MRLNAYLSRSGVCSRRKATLFIKDGKVKVNGDVVRAPWHVVAKDDKVTVSGHALREERAAYFLVNKPRGVASTVEDMHAPRKITDLVPKGHGRLYPIGRLDKDSRGLIILTNDGDLCYRLTHPKFEVEKEYVVTVKGLLDNKDLAQIKRGVFNEGDVLKVKSYSAVKAKSETTSLNVVIAEGKKRHLRRLFGGIGFPVVDLRRIRIGNIHLGELREGSFRKTDRERVYACLDQKAS